ncbi:MAG: hypothetical protein LBJ02_07795 [Bifidobacteriaceae bacterium]|nr:hypothetical protein [Bifidobacteriaceae bacterium]
MLLRHSGSWFRAHRDSAGHRSSAALAAVAAGLLVFALGGCGEDSKSEFEEGVTGKDKVAAGVGAAVRGELEVVANEVASWYTAGEPGDPKVVVSGGSYYICSAGESDCAAAGQLISSASTGIQMTMARVGKGNWCLQATTGSNEYHAGPGGSTEEGPC